MDKSILDMVHDSAKDLHAAGVMKETTMREFDALTFQDAEKNRHLWVKYFLFVSLLLVGCGQNDPGLAKTPKQTKEQQSEIEARICQYDANDCFLPIMASL